MKPKLKPLKSVPYTDFTLEIFTWKQRPAHRVLFSSGQGIAEPMRRITS